VWADEKVFVDRGGEVHVTKQPVDLTVPAGYLPLYLAQKQIQSSLSDTVSNFTRRNRDIKMFCTGGVDTLLLFSLLSQNNTEFDLVRDEHYELDTFTSTNNILLSKFWAYQQIHHWTRPTILATGSHGDEYLLRGPTVISMLTAWHDIDFGSVIESSDSYHSRYFAKYTDLWNNTWQTRHELRAQYPTVESLNAQILNILINDHQHWHLGYTLTWTPFKNIELARTLLQCSVDELMLQFTDAHITKELIADHNSNLLTVLSQYKNVNPAENLSKLSKFYHC
jgi:hypothetical protein